MIQQALKYLDVPLGNGAVLRVGLATGDGCEEGGELLLCAGWADSDRLEWRRLMAEGVSIPALSLPELRDALAKLSEAP